MSPSRIACAKVNDKRIHIHYKIVKNENSLVSKPNDQMASGQCMTVCILLIFDVQSTIYYFSSSFDVN